MSDPAPSGARARRVLIFVAQSITLGLAAAFLVVLFRPGLIARDHATVEVRETVSPAAPTGGPASYAAAVARAAPAVVNVNTAKVIAVQPHPLLNDPFFRQFFGDTIQGQNLPRQRLATSLGSGVIFSHQGYILTNQHVVAGADAIRVSLQDGRSADAKVIGSDPDTDLAVLKIDLQNLPAITLGDSDKLLVGDIVLAIGNPFGVGQTVTMGIVSATGRNQLGISTFENFIQTDAAINPGNSGGALVDARGDLIGVNTAIFSKSGGAQGIGFAIPTSMAKDVMEEIIRHGRVVRGWLGIEAHDLTPALARSLGLSRSEGVIVTGIVRGGPAHQAQLQPGDILVAIDDRPVASARQALNLISAHKPGDRVRLKVARDGKELGLDAVATTRPTRTGGTQ